MSGGGRKTLKTLIGTYPHTAPLKSSALRSDRLDFEFTEIVPVWDGFKGMIRDDKYDATVLGWAEFCGQDEVAKVVRERGGSR